MKKCICAFVCLMACSLYLRADEVVPSKLTEAGLKKHIHYLFMHIDFSNSECLSFDVFDKAYRGYLNLLNDSMLSESKNLLTICDLSISANQNRMWVIDLNKKKCVLNTLVAHGQGSGKEYATSFSNRNNTHKTSLGFYVTGDTYEGDHGISLHLFGMDPGFNNAAFDRGIVVHGADYVSKEFIENNENCLGRSWGCPAVPKYLSNTIIDLIKDSTCLFIYYPEKKYIARSHWLNQKIEHLPGTMPAKKPAKTVIKEITIQYVSADGKVDSVKKITPNPKAQ